MFVRDINKEEEEGRKNSDMGFSGVDSIALECNQGVSLYRPRSLVSGKILLS